MSRPDLAVVLAATCGPQLSGLRYCINSASLAFKQDGQERK